MLHATIKIGLGFSIVALSTIAATDARAEFELCNATLRPIWAAYSTFHNDRLGFRSEGWYKINTGRCKALIKGDLKNRYYYLHAHDDNGRYWDIDDDKKTYYEYCVNNKDAFTLYSERNCEDRNVSKQRFLRLILVNTLNIHST
jgi:uncharacterized membrane protein